MKRFLSALFLVLLYLTAGTAKAQEVYGNEWIDYSKTYHKLQVTETGLYKLDYNYLQQLGLANVNPQHLQLFRRGKELAIYVAGEADGRLDQQDYLEFYGERNDGALDQELYKNPSDQAHQLYSMYTDTAAYFLTVNPAGNNKRMREVNPSPNGLTPEPYHWAKALLLQTTNYSYGPTYSSSRMSWMDKAEGFTSVINNKKKTFTVTGITNAEPTGPAPKLDLTIVGPYDGKHKVEVSSVNGTARLLATVEFPANSYSRSSHSLSFTDINLAEGKLPLQFVSYAVNTESPTDYGVSYAEVTFPQKGIYTQNNTVVFTDSLRASPLYYQFAGAPATVVAYDVSDPSNVVKISGYANGNGKGYVLEQAETSHKLLLSNTATPLTPAAYAKGISFRNIQPENFNYLIVTNKRLMRPAKGSSLPAPQEYAVYRKSPAGGGYDTLLVFVSDLVNQFHYGEFSPNAIRRFSSFMLTSARPKHMLLMGKGVEVHERSFFNYRNPEDRAYDLVPTAGFPASDVLFSADFRHNSFAPKIATGRIFSTSPEEVISYLNKVKEYEATPDGLAWRKNVLHLSGGHAPDEIKKFAEYIAKYTSMAEGPLLGARVIEKTRQNLSDVTERLDVAPEVNEGLSLITFFGHSGTGGVDLDIGLVSSAVSNYKNKGKYPIILMNGCNVGNGYQKSSPSFGEDWINTADKGAIAFMAQVAAGYPELLDYYSENFYQVALQEEPFFGSTIGEIQQEVIKRELAKGTSWYWLNIAMVYQIALQGDPAVRMYGPEKPDYLIKENSFSLKGKNGDAGSAVSDSLVLSFDGQNFGKAILQPIYASVKRTLPSGEIVQTDSILVDPILHTSRVSLTLPNKGLESAGINIFEVKLDSPDAVEELKEDNNTAVFQKYISESGLAVVSPRKYGVVGTDKATLAVQASLFGSKRDVFFQVDTSATFSSPWLKSTTVANTGFASWEVPMINSTPPDSTVYFWRARFREFQPGEDTVWVNSSFRHIPAVTAGWSQSHKGQFTEASLQGVDSLDQQTGIWKLSTVRKFISMKTVGGELRYKEPPHGFFIDGAQQMSWRCGYPAYHPFPRFFLVAFNNITLEPVTDLPGVPLCSYTPYLFDTNNLTKAANVAKIKKFIDAVPEGYYVAVMSINNVPFDNLPEDAKAAFRSIGSELIDQLKTGDPFAIMGVKGAAPGTAQEMTYSPEEAERDGGTPRNSQDIVLDVTLRSNRNAGTITSTTIGPALRWKSLHHNVVDYDGGQDEYTLSLIGITAAGQEEVLEKDITSKSLDISSISASQYPSLKLSLFVSDSVARTAPQLKEWFVLYDPLPEGIVRPDLVKADEEELTKQASGGRIKVPMAFQNVSTTSFTDSLTVEAVLRGEGISATTSRFKIKPVEAGETVYFDYEVLTEPLDGNYTLSLYVNPELLPEQVFTNNIYEVSFNVKSKLHPIMDVAFDGIHILDGDIVSPSPLISVTVKDENSHVFLQDPSKMSLVLLTPEEGDKEIELMDNPEVVYTPATETSDFKLEYKPALLPDGKYTLQVRAQDAAGRDSGVSPYKIGFEVVSESSISNFYPFPNPFSTKTNFIFTITGSTIPEHIKIQILTITGKVVKEIMKEELGPLRIGNNKTAYAWDGTDMYGDKLANGVYLYRVIMSKGAEEMKHRNTFGDGAFKNGYGKLYILR
ncbi:putative type IX secretion system sortase PorU2 [Pontibacter mangrovi]|nr:C25 family cysteine peptidase [Pontibacter mangrovi]